MVNSEGQSSLKTKMLALVSVLASKLALTSDLYIWPRPGLGRSRPTLALFTLWSLRCHCDFHSFIFDPAIGLEKVASASILASCILHQ